MEQERSKGRRFVVRERMLWLGSAATARAFAHPWHAQKDGSTD